MDGGAWWATVPGVTKSWTRLSNFTFLSFLPLISKSVWVFTKDMKEHVLRVPLIHDLFKELMIARLTVLE